MLDLGFGGCVIPTLIHFGDFANPNESKIMSQLCGKLYNVSCVGQASGEE